MSKADKFYFESFKRCAALAKKAANYLVESLRGYDAEKIEKMLDEMHSIEHEADGIKHEVSEALAKAFVTPVDREDLDLLSHRFDDVIDLIEEVLQKFYIYDVKEIKPDAVTFAEKIARSCEIIYDITVEFERFKKSNAVRGLIISLNDVEEECDELYMSSMREITKNEKDVFTALCWYKIFECFEKCADTCEHVGDCVDSVIMKNS